MFETRHREESKRKLVKNIFKNAVFDDGDRRRNAARVNVRERLGTPPPKIVQSQFFFLLSTTKAVAS
jgi:hypothetical protein